MGENASCIFVLGVILFCGKSDQALAVDVNSERVIGGYNDIYSQIELVSV